MILLTTNDFRVGRFKIPKDTNGTNDLQWYINKVQGSCLPALFGVELYDLFIVDLALAVATDPTAPRFVYIDNPFTYQYDDNTIIESKGITEMLKGFVYFEYVRDLPTQVSNVGIEESKSENSSEVSAIKHNVIGRYNDAIDTYKVIQFYMDQVDPTTYPEFKGIGKRYAHPF